MQRKTLLALMIAAQLLTGCIEPEQAGINEQDAAFRERADLVAQSLENFILNVTLPGMKANTLIEGGGTVQFQAMLCPTYDGSKTGTVYAWIKNTNGIDAQAVKAALAKRAGAGFAGIMDGPMWRAADGSPVYQPDWCRLPMDLKASPFVAIRLGKIEDSAFEEKIMSESRAENCPEGFKGMMRKTRKVHFTTAGTVAADAWETDDMAGCSPDENYTITAKTQNAPAWKVAGETTAAAELNAAAPQTCKTWTVDGKKGNETTSYDVTTCDATQTITPMSAPQFETNPGGERTVISCVITWSGAGVMVNNGEAARLRSLGFWVKEEGGRLVTTVLGTALNQSSKPIPCPCGVDQLKDYNAATESYTCDF